MKKCYCVLMVLVMVASLFGCSKKKDTFEQDAIKAIEDCKHVKSQCETLGIDDINVEILKKEVEKDEAEVKCEITYEGKYVVATETLKCELEKDDDEWQVEKVKSKDVEYELVKFPDKYEIGKMKIYDTEMYCLKAESVENVYNEDSLYEVGYVSDGKEFEYTYEVYSVSDDYSNGYVAITIEYTNGTEVYLEAELDFDDEIGKWIYNCFNISTSRPSADNDKPSNDNDEPEEPSTDNNNSDKPSSNGELQRPCLDDYGSGEITIWVESNMGDLTKTYADKFLDSDPLYSGYTIKIEEFDAGDAAKNMIADVESGADLYVFSQEKLPELVMEGALYDLSRSYYEQYIMAKNDSASIKAANYGGLTYAFPIASDNGYFLYYDKSIVKDTSTLEAVVAACEAAGKEFRFEINNGWYQTAFFFGTGCELTYDVDSNGTLSECNASYNSDAGLVALKEMIELVASPSFVNSSSLSWENNCAAAVSGTWYHMEAKELFGDDYGACKLPEFIGCDGKVYQLSGFGGFRLLGVKPQYDMGKAIVCLNLAEYLSSAEVQLARYECMGYGPSNLEAQQDYSVQSEVAYSALIEQLNYCVPQGLYAGDYWDSATEFGDEIIGGTYDMYSSDEELMAALAQLEADFKGFID